MGDYIFVVDTHLPRFEALAYVLPHFDTLTRVLGSSFKGLPRSDILSSQSVHLLKSLLNLLKAYIDL